MRSTSAAVSGARQVEADGDLGMRHGFNFCVMPCVIAIEKHRVTACFVYPG
jgi:hypothetical protein